jgi:pimeloyl-ACP methyl ester carboxylesterase
MVNRMAASWTRTQARLGGLDVRLDRAGDGPPLLLLHHDIGTLERLPIYDALAERFEVLLPQHPGYGSSERPEWMRSVRDLAALYRWLLAALGVSRPTLLGLGFGGWIAAELATMAPRDVARLVLVGAMGLKPPASGDGGGDILDQALVSHIDYARAFFHDQASFAALYGDQPSVDQLVEWDLCREMNFRIAWKPYMYSQTLPYLLGGVTAPALVVWGEHDRVVPRGAGALYARHLPDARLEIVRGCGHAVEMERPAELVRLVTSFVQRG